MATVTLNDAAEKVLESYAKQKDLSRPEAASKLILTAASRLLALKKYNEKQQEKKGPKKPKAKKEKVAKVKVAKAPKEEKAPVIRRKKRKVEVSPDEVHALDAKPLPGQGPEEPVEEQAAPALPEMSASDLLKAEPATVEEEIRSIPF